MRRGISFVGAVVLLAGSISIGSAGYSASEVGTYIVTLKPGVDSAAAAAGAEAQGASVGYVYRFALNGYAADMSAQAASALLRNPQVLSVVADRPVSIAAPPCPSPPCGGGGGGGDSQPPQSTPTGIARISGPGTANVNVDVAVIDTGIDSSHPDLNVIGGVNCSTGRSFQDGNGHGTHVAGTIGAIDNGIGVVGVAPGVELWAVRVLNNAGSGTWASVICGVDWAADPGNGIEVANMSLGGSGSDTGCSDGGLHQAICNAVSAGVTFVVAAGNSADDSANHVPAAYDEVITVSALADFDGQAGGEAPATCRDDQDDTFADFSNFGADVDLIAPGVCILSTWNGGGYNTISGTSMATPHVTGAAALYIAAHSGATPAQVKSGLQTAGNLNWNDADDPDGTKEQLVAVN